jgi:hypothetical protein
VARVRAIFGLHAAREIFGRANARNRLAASN